MLFHHRIIPGIICDICPPYRMPNGKYKCNASPTIRPRAAPILNTGINIPDGTGMVEAIIEKTNWNAKYLRRVRKILVIKYISGSGDFLNIYREK